MTEGENILRRYFVMNGFDGALTALGIILGSFIVSVSGETDLESVKILISTGIGASIAMGVSGFWIAYLTEKAERTKERKELEQKMVTDLNNTRISRANFWTSLVIALVDGISPFMFSVLALLPIFFVFIGLPLMIAYIISFCVIGVEVIILGLFLGAVSKENKLIYALKIIPAALLVAGLTFLLELFV
ncbi:MAG: VIT1/CCC1 transporter family protein [Candidatus Heimdallarchaeaceae archaeon]